MSVPAFVCRQLAAHAPGEPRTEAIATSLSSWRTPKPIRAHACQPASQTQPRAPPPPGVGRARGVEPARRGHRAGRLPDRVLQPGHARRPGARAPRARALGHRRGRPGRHPHRAEPRLRGAPAAPGRPPRFPSAAECRACAGQSCAGKCALQPGAWELWHTQSWVLHSMQRAGSNTLHLWLGAVLRPQSSLRRHV